MVLLSACGGGDPTLIGPGAGAGEALPDARGGQSYVIGGMSLCVDHGQVSITAVSLAHALGGLTVQGWGVRQVDAGVPTGDGHPSDGTGSPQTLAGFPDFGHVPVTGRCTEPAGETSQFVVQVGKPTDATASADAILVHYLRNGREATAIEKLTVVLCGPADTTGVCRK